MLIAGNTLKRKNTNINLNNIVRHKVEPSGINISLTEWPMRGGKYTVSINLTDFSSNIITLKKFLNENDAKKYYHKVLTSINNGKYKLHLFDSGDVKLTLM